MKKQVITLMITMLILFGTVNTILLKLQNIQIINQATGAKFFHPFMQTICMFIGQCLVGFAYLLSRQKENRQQLSLFNNKQKAPLISVLLPTVMDLFSTLLSYSALNMVASSVWQISRGGNIIFTALFSAFFLKRKFSRSAIVGCCLAFIGITGVQLVTVLSGNSSSENDLTQQIIGIILLLLSIIFNSIGLVMQKNIFNRYEISPLKMVFLEGLYGLIFMIPITFASQYITCPWSDNRLCSNVGGEFYLQNFKLYWADMQTNIILICCNFGLIVSIGLSVPIAVTVSKKISPVSRSLADVCRTLFIWLFGIIMTLTVGVDNKTYDMQDLSALVNTLKAFGFIILIIGTLMYHDLLPIWQEKQASIIESIIEDEGEQSQSAKQPFLKTSKVNG